MKTVAVFFGGRSNEREISIITGMLAVNLLRGAGYRVLPVYITQEGKLLLCERARGVEEFRTIPAHIPVEFAEGGLCRRGRLRRRISVDCALNCCHGGAGEDGTLSALLSWFGIPSASPSSAPSAVYMDKELSKALAKGLGIPVVESVALHERDWTETAEEEAEETLGYPMIVKPCKLGSSIGISVVKTREELRGALRLAYRLDGSVLLERYLEEKRDLNCAAYCRGGEIVLSPIEEVFSSGEILSFGEKYERAERASKIPAELPSETAEELAVYMRRLYRSAGLFGVVRGDFLYAGGKLYFNELNTVPGSLAYYLFGDSLTAGREFLVTLIEEALSQRDGEKELISTGILNGPGFGGGKRAKRPI